jgi:hypothetical protein
LYEACESTNHPNLFEECLFTLAKYFQQKSTGSTSAFLPWPLGWQFAQGDKEITGAITVT